MRVPCQMEFRASRACTFCGRWCWRRRSAGKKALFSSQGDAQSDENRCLTPQAHPNDDQKRELSISISSLTATNTIFCIEIHYSSWFSTWIWWVACLVCLLLTNQPAIRTIQQRSPKSGCNGGAPSMLLWRKGRRSYVAMAMAMENVHAVYPQTICHGSLFIKLG